VDDMHKVVEVADNDAVDKHAVGYSDFDGEDNVEPDRSLVVMCKGPIVVETYKG